MALDQSDLLEMLEALKLADVDEGVRTATEHLYQALIDAEWRVTSASSRRVKWYASNGRVPISASELCLLVPRHVEVAGVLGGAGDSVAQLVDVLGDVTRPRRRDIDVDHAVHGSGG